MLKHTWLRPNTPAGPRLHPNCEIVPLGSATEDAKQMTENILVHLSL